MEGKSWRVCVLVALFAFALVCASRAQDAKPTDEGSATKFKGKTFDLKAPKKGKSTSAAIILSFPAKRTATVTVESEKETDINLYVYDADKKEVAKDDSPGPSCKLTFRPKEKGKFTLVVKNLGPGENKSTLKVTFKKRKKKAEE
jgi:hypothetical protein